MSANLKIISDLRNFIAHSSQNVELRQLFTNSSKDFSRKRKLHFELVVCMLLNFFKRSYDIEISDFFNHMGTEELKATKSAFSQQRLKINSFFFSYLNTVRPNRKMPKIKKLKRRAGKYKTLTNYKRAI